MEHKYLNIFKTSVEKATGKRLWDRTIKCDRYTEGNVIIDVRAPCEFLQSHVPFAHNVPLLTDEERASVGKLFKKEGKDAAVKLGLEFVEKKIVQIGQSISDLVKGKKTLIIYCRGGRMRSSSVCYFVSQCFPDLAVYRLEGGHKGYRQWVLNYSSPMRVVLITGRTGSGKTKVLHELKRLGEQTIDLEGMALHKGSAFGLLEHENQPSSKLFQNRLIHEFRKLDTNRILYLEHEGKRIGSCHVPNTLQILFSENPYLIIHVHKTNVSSRVETILEDYGNFSADELVKCVKKIKKKFGQKKVEICANLIEQGNLKDAIAMLLIYYDRLYDKGLVKRLKQVKSNAPKHDLHFVDNDYIQQAKAIVKEAKKYEHNLHLQAKKRCKLISTLLIVFATVSILVYLQYWGVFLNFLHDEL